MKYQDILFSSAIIIGFLLPHSSFVALLVNPVLWFLLFFANRSDRPKTPVFYFAATGLVLSLAVNLLDPAITEFTIWGRVALLLTYILFFPAVSNVRIPQVILYFVLGVIVLSQISFAFNLGVLTGFIDIVWPYEGDGLGYQTDFLARRVNQTDSVLGNFRWGGIYRNPNQCVRYVSLILTVFLLETRESSLLKRLPFLLLVGVSVLLAGSRTGFLVCSCLILCDLIFLKRKAWAKWVAFALGIGGIATIMLSPALKESYRIFDLGEGRMGSIGTKIEWFWAYFTSMSPWEFLFGAVSPMYLVDKGVTMLDSEWGYYFYLYGVIASVGLLTSIIWLWREGKSNTRFFMIVSLWGITSSVLLSNRMSFVYLLFLSVYFCRDKFQKTTSVINNGNQVIRFKTR